MDRISAAVIDRSVTEGSAGFRRVIAATGLVVALVASGCGEKNSPDQTTTTEETAPATSSTTESQEENEASEPVLRSWDEFIQGQEIPDSTIELVKNATLRVDTGSSLCTGMIINNVLATAAHCAGDSMTLYRWQTGFEVPVATVGRWGYDTSKDLMVGVDIEYHEEGVNTIQIDTFSEQDPAAGQQFVVSSLPGNGEAVYWATLTYLGHDPNRAIAPQVFALDPGVPPDIASAILPGSSGSAIVDGGNNVSILRYSEGPTNPDGTPNENWPTAIAYYQPLFNLDLAGSGSLRLVYAEGLGQRELDDLVTSAGGP